MISDKWLQRYRLLENFNKEILLFEDVLDLTSSPTPSADPEADVMECKLTLLGTYGSSMNAF